MPNPPTQGRPLTGPHQLKEERILRGAKALREQLPHIFVTGPERAEAMKVAQAVLDAAYPQQMEGDGREWRIEKQWSGATIVSPGLEEVHDPITVVLKSRLIAAEQRAEKAERERDEARVVGACPYHERQAEQAEADRDRLQRECDKLRKILKELVRLIDFPELGSKEHIEWIEVLKAARSALDALEKP